MTAGRCALMGLATTGLLGAPPAPAAVSRFPRDFLPVAAEGSARAVWVHPAGLGSGGEQSLLVEGTWRENDEFPRQLATLTVAASTDRTGYALVRELEDVPGRPDWVLLAAKRVARRRGLQLGGTLEWRGGEGRTVDATFALGTRPGSALGAAVVLEDAFASDVDGEEGSRRWRGGLAFRPVGGGTFFSWDYDRRESDDEGRHWFALGLDRGRNVLFRGALSDRGDWSIRLGLATGNARVAGALSDPDVGEPTAVTSVELVAGPIVR